MSEFFLAFGDGLHGGAVKISPRAMAIGSSKPAAPAISALAAVFRVPAYKRPSDQGAVSSLGQGGTAGGLARARCRLAAGRQSVGISPAFGQLLGPFGGVLAPRQGDQQEYWGNRLGTKSSVYRAAPPLGTARYLGCASLSLPNRKKSSLKRGDQRRLNRPSGSSLSCRWGPR